MMEASINEAKLYYAHVGNPITVPTVLVHGSPFNHNMWNPQTEILKKNYKFRVITYYIRGLEKQKYELF